MDNYDAVINVGVWFGAYILNGEIRIPLIGTQAEADEIAELIRKIITVRTERESE